MVAMNRHALFQVCPSIVGLYRPTRFSDLKINFSYVLKMTQFLILCSKSMVFGTEGEEMLCNASRFCCMCAD
jgi:hypothetical protein